MIFHLSMFPGLSRTFQDFPGSFTADVVKNSLKPFVPPEVHEIHSVVEMKL